MMHGHSAAELRCRSASTAASLARSSTMGLSLVPKNAVFSLLSLLRVFATASRDTTLATTPAPPAAGDSSFTSPKMDEFRVRALAKSPATHGAGSTETLLWKNATFVQHGSVAPGAQSGARRGTKFGHVTARGTQRGCELSAQGDDDRARVHVSAGDAGEDDGAQVEAKESTERLHPTGSGCRCRSHPFRRLASVLSADRKSILRD
mmetsp:Transcript_94962/g.245269  ORF Transcript_94962/g.245269 Transcript_94962/m.245269 type:complete len:206 (-) Transcript_94962:52-669(-)